MAAKLIIAQAVDFNGNILNGAKLNVYEAGTTTRRTVYATSSLSTAISNPVVAGADGGIVAWIDDTAGDYKATLTNSAESATFFSRDNIPATSGNFLIYPLNGDQGVNTTDAPTFAGATFTSSITVNGVTISPEGAVVGQALGFPNSATVAEPFTPSGAGDTLKAADETITGDWSYSPINSSTGAVSRSLKDKLRDFATPEDFGFDEAGATVAANTTAFNAWGNAGGGYLREGQTYTVFEAEIGSDNFQIHGSPGAVIQLPDDDFEGLGDAAYILRISNETKNFRIDRGVKFDGKRGERAAAGLTSRTIGLNIRPGCEDYTIDVEIYNTSGRPFLGQEQARRAQYRRMACYNVGGGISIQGGIDNEFGDLTVDGISGAVGNEARAIIIGSQIRARWSGTFSVLHQDITDVDAMGILLAKCPDSIGVFYGRVSEQIATTFTSNQGISAVNCDGLQAVMTVEGDYSPMIEFRNRHGRLMGGSCEGVHRAASRGLRCGPVNQASEDLFRDGQINIRGSVTSGPFEVGETITGGTSGATGTVLRAIGEVAVMYNKVSGKFEDGETFTGGTSGASATIGIVEIPDETVTDPQSNRNNGEMYVSDFYVHGCDEGYDIKSAGVQLANCVAVNCADHGFITDTQIGQLFFPDMTRAVDIPARSVLRGCRAYNCGESGFEFIRSEGLDVIDCTAEGCGWNTALVVGNRGGARFDPAGDNDHVRMIDFIAGERRNESATDGLSLSAAFEDLDFRDVRKGLTLVNDSPPGYDFMSGDIVTFNGYTGRIIETFGDDIEVRMETILIDISSVTGTFTTSDTVTATSTHPITEATATATGEVTNVAGTTLTVSISPLVALGFGGAIGATITGSSSGATATISKVYVPRGGTANLNGTWASDATGLILTNGENGGDVSFEIEGRLWLYTGSDEGQVLSIEYEDGTMTFDVGTKSGGNFAAGDTITSGGNTATILTVNNSTGVITFVQYAINVDAGGSFEAGDTIDNGSGVTADIATGGDATGNQSTVNLVSDYPFTGSLSGATVAKSEENISRTSRQPVGIRAASGSVDDLYIKGFLGRYNTVQAMDVDPDDLTGGSEFLLAATATTTATANLTVGNLSVKAGGFECFDARIEVTTQVAGLTPTTATATLQFNAVDLVLVGTADGSGNLVVGTKAKSGKRLYAPASSNFRIVHSDAPDAGGVYRLEAWLRKERAGF